MNSRFATNSTMQKLSKLHFHSNWEFTSTCRRDFLILNRSGELEDVLCSLAQGYRLGLTEPDQLGIAIERPFRMDHEATLRIVQYMHPLHASRVDVSLMKRGPDIFVRVGLAGQTWHRYLTWFVVFVLTATLVVLTGMLYVHWTKAVGIMMDDTVRQNQPAAVEAPIAARSGWAIDPVTQEWIAVEYPQVSYVAVENPRQLWMHFAGPFTAILAAASTISYVVRRPMELLVSNVLGWPSALAFDDFGSANEAWSIGVLNSVLSNYGVSEVEKVTT